MNIEFIKIIVANPSHLNYTKNIADIIDEASKEKNTGLARRTHDYIASKILEGKAIIAIDGTTLVGFCYIESWGHDRFVANSGLVVKTEYRGLGLAKEIKKKALELSMQNFPEAKIFGLTTGLAVMNINHALGYRPVTFSELTDDEDFWQGCKSCVNYDILVRTNRTKCLCTGMLLDPFWNNKTIKQETSNLAQCIQLI